MSFAVAIDGPSGAGKSSLAKKLALHYGLLYIDTGAMYRAIALYAMRRGVDPHDHARVIPLLEEVHLELRHAHAEQRIEMNGEDVTKEVRREEVGMGAAAVSSCPQVRTFLVEWQRSLAKQENIIMDGRDIGTVVLPDAQVKIFLTASAAVRAQRRYLELCEKGVDTTYEKVLALVEKRDYEDTHREQSPLCRAEDAVLVDTSDCDFDEAFRRLCSVIDRKRKDD